MEHRTIAFPAYDKQEHGRHGVDLQFVVGDNRSGWLSLTIFTNWMLPQSPLEFTKSIPRAYGVGVDSHLPEPLTDDHIYCPSCEITGTSCYGTAEYSIGFAGELFEHLVAHGTEGPDGLWARLEQLHSDVLGHYKDQE